MYEDLKQRIANSDKIVFFGGAGVSTESNIPDFRSEAGLYKAVEAYGYSPEELLSHSFFMQKPQIFFDYYKTNLIYRDAEPNKAHLALAKLENDGKLLSVITQNIDGLHQKAGSKRVHELHGSVHRNYCMSCNAFYDLDYILKEENCKAENKAVPVCAKCGGTVKPDVVLYEEMLDDNVMAQAISDIREADCLIIGGTSLAVYPAAGLINYFRGNHIVLINKTATQNDSGAEIVIRAPIGAVLGQVCGVQ
ncbi:MAG: NAD-dependent protein deacylase [Eubacteriales bacterium]|nr:NAD-dependent protein deacylase [Eubacteriales bacterium]